VRKKFQEGTITLEYCPTAAGTLTKVFGKPGHIRYTTDLLVEQMLKPHGCHNSQPLIPQALNQDRDNITSRCEDVILMTQLLHHRLGPKV
jgi:hypothetical protein